MNTVQIKSFLMAAELLSFTAAAERLYISQPTLSHQISMLEQEVGSSLFTRYNNILVLTQTGAMLKRSLTSVSLEIDDVLRRIKESDSLEAGCLSVGLLEDQLLDNALIDGLHRMLKNRPGIELNIERRNAKNLFQGLMDGTLDAAVQLVYEDTAYSDFRALALSEESECVAIAKNHPAAARDTVCLADVTDLMYELPLVLAALETFPEPLRGRLAREPFVPEGQDGGDPRTKTVSSISTIPLFVTAGLAFSLVNESHILAIDPNVKLIQISDVYTMKKGVIWRKGNANPALAEFLAILGDSDMTR